MAVHKPHWVRLSACIYIEQQASPHNCLYSASTVLTPGLVGSAWINCQGLDNWQAIGWLPQLVRMHRNDHYGKRGLSSIPSDLKWGKGIFNVSSVYSNIFEDRIPWNTSKTRSYVWLIHRQFNSNSTIVSTAPIHSSRQWKLSFTDHFFSPVGQDNFLESWHGICTETFLRIKQDPNMYLRWCGTDFM